MRRYSKKLQPVDAFPKHYPSSIESIREILQCLVA